MMKKLSQLRLALWIGVTLFLIGVLISLRAYAAAAGCWNCPLTNILMRGNGWALIGTSLNMNLGLACGNANNQYMSVDTATTKGRSALAMAQAALLAGRRIDMIGTNACPGGTVDVEEMSTLFIRP